MGWFKKNKESNKQVLTKYNITMTATGKIAEGVKTLIVPIEEDGEFMAVRAAEKLHPELKVAKVEKAG